MENDAFGGKPVWTTENVDDVAPGTAIGRGVRPVGLPHSQLAGVVRVFFV